MSHEKGLRVLHLTTHLNLGGISSYLAILGPALTRRGHKILVLSSGGAKSAELEQKSVGCFTMPIRTKNELHPKLWMTLLAASDLVKKEKIDLLHAHTRVTEVFAAALSGLTGVPMVATAHGFYKAGIGRRLFPCWGERVVAVSDLVAEELWRSHGVQREKITVISNALDVDDLEARLRAQDRARVREEYGIPRDSFLIGCISRLVRDKGQEYLVEAMMRLSHDLPQAYLCIVGDGREKTNLEALIQKNSLGGRVKLIAGVNDTTGLLATFDVFAHPATFREGFGLSMAEAMLARVPVVATRIPAIDTLFRDGEEILLVPPKDSAALAAAILRIAKDPALKRRLAESGHTLASKQCRAERQAEEMETVYREVLEKWKIKKN